MVLKIRLTYRILLFIQNRFQARYYQREAKLEILENAWNKLCGQLNYKNVNYVKSLYMSEMIIKI